MFAITEPTVAPYGPLGYGPTVDPASPPLLPAPPSAPPLPLPLEDEELEPPASPPLLLAPLLLPLAPLLLPPLPLPLAPLDPPPASPVVPLPPPGPELPEHAARSAANAPKPVKTRVVFTITFPFVERRAT
jgi:hypothetical protein